MNQKTVKGYLFAVLSAVIYGCMPLMARHIYNDGVDPFTLVFLRNLFSVIPLAVLAYIENKTLKIPIKLLPKIGIISVLGCCITPILLFTSYNYIESGTATVFHFSYPAIVLIGEILFLRKKAQIHSIISVLLCICGISFFYSPTQPLNFTGSALSLCSGITFASYVILLSHFNSDKVSGFLFSFYIAVISSIATLIICLATNGVELPKTLYGWGLCVLFSLLVTTGAVVLFQQSAFLIGGERSSILSTLEPITSVLIGVLFMDEEAGIPVIIGTVLVVTASVLSAVYDIKKTQKA